MRQYRTTYRQPRTQVRLTESELHQVINEAVEQVLIDEGFWGGVQGVGKAAWNGVKNMWGGVKNAWNQGSMNQDQMNALQYVRQVSQQLNTYAQNGVLEPQSVQAAVQALQGVRSNRDKNQPNQNAEQPTQGNGQQPMQNQPNQQGGAA